MPGPDLVVCDEGHRIKNDATNISQALKKIQTRWVGRGEELGVTGAGGTVTGGQGELGVTGAAGGATCWGGRF